MHLVKKKERTYEKAKEILTSKNLLINDGKTERIKRRGKRMERCDKIRIKAWRSGRHQEKKRIGDHIALAKNDIIWKKKWKTKLTTRVKLYETLVKSVLLYNYGTWGVSKDDQRKLNSFHRNQLRKVVGIQWPHNI